ncbi:MAG: hypothetical protein KAJ08_09910, partial [Deltaproteobacteria bacterium]|nr:hypothetical protein [Deltaproteobacteria bacterium]
MLDNKIETSLDGLVSLVNDKGALKISNAAKILDIEESTLDELVKVLVDRRIIEIHYSLTGSRVIKPGEMMEEVISKNEKSADDVVEPEPLETEWESEKADEVNDLIGAMKKKINEKKHGTVTDDGEVLHETPEKTGKLQEAMSKEEKKRMEEEKKRMKEEKKRMEEEKKRMEEDKERIGTELKKRRMEELFKRREAEREERGSEMGMTDEVNAKMKLIKEIASEDEKLSSMDASLATEKNQIMESEQEISELEKKIASITKKIKDLDEGEREIERERSKKGRKINEIMTKRPEIQSKREGIL